MVPKPKRSKAKPKGKKELCEEAGATHQEANRLPNIHLLKKPSWYTGEETPIREEQAENSNLGLFRGAWGTLVSALLVIALVLPLLAVLSITLMQFGAFPSSLTPHMFASQPIGNERIIGAWALALLAFIPWAVLVTRAESLILRN
jgi:hypothetical protein